MRAEAKKPIKSRKTGAKLYASTVSKLLVVHHSSQRDKDYYELQNMEGTPEFTRGVLLYSAISCIHRNLKFFLNDADVVRRVENGRMKNVEMVDIM